MEARRPTALMAHVLFLDLVRSSTLSIDEFGRHTSEFRKIVTETHECRSNSAVARVQIEDTGDGLALAFLDDPTSPAECVDQVRAAIGSRPHLIIRAGIHSGPLLRVEGLEGPKLTGAAFVEAKRLMDAGRPGEVLVSREAASVLRHFDKWLPRLGLERVVPTKGDRGSLIGFPLLAHSEAEERPAASPRRSRVSARLALGVAAGSLATTLIALGGWTKGRETQSPGAAGGIAKERTTRPIECHVRDLGAATGEEQVCLNNRDQIAVGYGGSPDCPPALMVDGRTGRRDSLGRPMYRPQVSDTGAICAFSEHAIVWRSPGAPASKQVKIIPYEAVHGHTFINRGGSRVFFYNAQGNVAGRWSIWGGANRQVLRSLQPSLDDAYINDLDHVVGQMGPSTVTYRNDIYTSIPTNGVPAGISDSGDFVIYDKATNATSVYSFKGEPLARAADFDVKATEQGMQMISSANCELVIGRTPSGWSVLDVWSGETLPISTPGWKLRWIASINSKNEMVAVGTSSRTGLRLLLLTPEPDRL